MDGYFNAAKKDIHTPATEVVGAGEDNVSMSKKHHTTLSGNVKNVGYLY